MLELERDPEQVGQDRNSQEPSSDRRGPVHDRQGGPTALHAPSLNGGKPEQKNHQRRDHKEQPCIDMRRGHNQQRYHGLGAGQIARRSVRGSIRFSADTNS
jgi:hypothetical protein